jgi:hypothetical protein
VRERDREKQSKKQTNTEQGAGHRTEAIREKDRTEAKEGRDNL